MGLSVSPVNNLGLGMGLSVVQYVGLYVGFSMSVGVMGVDRPPPWKISPFNP